jgi:PAP2 superfamily protein
VTAQDTAVQHISGPEPARARSWRLPQTWRERTDWVPLDTTLGQALRGLRWGAIAVYVLVAAYYGYHDGLPFDREGLLLWIAIGLSAFCIGRHPVWMLWVAIDFVPFALVLVVYDYLRGLSDRVGMPTWWHPQLDVDTFLFAGHEPTVWLQEHLKHARYVGVRWYDLVVCVSYYSFFFLPYVMAGVMWLRGRADFYRWSLRFVGLSFFAFSLFLLIPAAPPWAAALCTAKEVAGHPNDPACMHTPAHAVPGNLLGQFSTAQSGANPYVERIAGDSFYKLHLGVAHGLWTKGFSAADAVAAVPSLHLGGTVLFCMFMWSRVRRWWRPLLVAYPLVMMFSLAYSGEHYVADGIAGALAAWLVHSVANRIEARRKHRRSGDHSPDTLGDRATPSDPTQELSCPPTHPLPATTPSST